MVLGGCARARGLLGQRGMSSLPSASLAARLRQVARLLATLWFAAGSGCQLYFDDPHGDPPLPCLEAPYGGDAIGGRLRDPQTGTCTSFGGEPGPCGAYYDAPAAIPDWGYCDTACEAMDEATCLAADGCRAVYSPARGANGALAFAGCWSTAMSGPVQGGGCKGLDAYECSLHDDCSVIHDVAPSDGLGPFRSCVEEVVICAYDGVYADALPPFRNPETGQCESFGGPPGDPCDPTAGSPTPDWAFCGTSCEWLDEAACQDAAGCRAIYVDTCPPNAPCYAEMLEFAGCWGTAPSGPGPSGTCDGLTAYDCSRRDDCSAFHATDWQTCAGLECGLAPAEFLACLAEPEPPPVPCAAHAVEEACILAGCEPLYQGEGCVCADDSCTCDSWHFQSCRDPQ